MSRHKVIFDTDPGIDDAMALLFLHHHPDIDLVGITTVLGNASIETTTRNALFMKREWEIDAPVARGAGAALHLPYEPPPTVVHGVNGLGDIPIPDRIDVPLDPRPAYRFIVETVRARPGEVTIVAVGRMTNLALALQEDAEIARLVKAVVIMGGAVYVPGNVTPAAEANIAGDPHAADIVMTTDWPVVVVGLDVTRQTVMTRAEVDEMGRTGPRAKLLADISQFYLDFYDRHVPGGMLVHDSCACVYVVAPELFTVKRGPIRVATEGVAIGETIQREEGIWYRPGAWDDLPSQAACVGVDAPAVMRLLKETIVRPG